MTEKTIDRSKQQGRLLHELVSLAESAGEAILDVYKESDFGTSFKADHSPLTRADLASHHLIINGLEGLTPQFPALSEESRSVSTKMRRGWESYWLIDPLDGTKEFIKRNDEFTVNIALIEKGRSIMGVVHAPAFDVTYFAARGTGAFKKRPGKESVRISAGDYRNKPLKIATSRSHGKEETMRLLEKIGEHEVVEVGSSLKLCLVAEGAVSLYLRFGRTMEWDTAAADCIVVEAGGSVTDFKGSPLQYNKPDLSNPDFLVRGNPPIPLETILNP